MGGTTTKVLGGIALLIGMYLVLTNPRGDSAVANALGPGGGVPVIKSLQGR